MLIFEKKSLNTCTSRDYIDSYLRDISGISDHFIFDRESTVIVDHIGEDNFTKSAGLIIKSLGSVDCDPVCNVTKQKRAVDNLNYLMLRLGVNN
jgi:hypothetical protein